MNQVKATIAVAGAPEETYASKYISVISPPGKPHDLFLMPNGNCIVYRGAAAQCFSYQPALWAKVVDEYNNGIGGIPVTFGVAPSSHAMLFPPEAVNALNGDQLVLKIPYHGDSGSVASGSTQITGLDGSAFMELVVLDDATVTVTSTHPDLAGKWQEKHFVPVTPPDRFLRVMNYHDLDQLAGYAHKRLPFPVTVRAFKEVDGMAEPVNASIKFSLLNGQTVYGWLSTNPAGPGDGATWTGPRQSRLCDNVCRPRTAIERAGKVRAIILTILTSTVAGQNRKKLHKTVDKCNHYFRDFLAVR